jgi:hypothetical protein
MQEQERVIEEAEDDQEFLTRNKNAMSVKEKVKDKTKKATDVLSSPSVLTTSSPAAPSPSSKAADFFQTLNSNKFGTSSPIASNVASKQFPSSPMTPSPLPTTPTTPSSASSRLPNSPNFTSNDQISKFFNDLLAKKK